MKKHYFAVIDTNILVAALLSKKTDTAVVRVFDKIIDGEIIPLYSEAVLKEYREVLLRRKFRFNTETVESLLDFIAKSGSCMYPKKSGIVLPDKKDVPFYEIVLDKKEDGAYLITGNKKHFPDSPIVFTAREFLDSIEA